MDPRALVKLLKNEREKLQRESFGTTSNQDILKLPMPKSSASVVRFIDTEPQTHTRSLTSRQDPLPESPAARIF